MLVSEEIVVAIRGGGGTVAAKLSVGYESGDIPALRLETDDSPGKVISVQGQDFFSALCALRSNLEERGMYLLCAGASEDVFPSPMSIEMSEGRMAYRLQMGRKAARSDLVDIFATDVPCEPATVEQQRRFYDLWLQSLRHI